MPFGYTHRVIRQLAQWAVYSFFGQVEVVNGDNVPRAGPVIIACSHHNMSVDPAVLSSTFPHGRMLHYWAKSTLFGHPVAKLILTNAGNIPVNRKVRDNQVLFRGTFDALAAGDVVAIFPEGTSYTEPRIMQVKDGVSWTALEYTKWLQTPDGIASGGKNVTIVPASIVYTDKSKYRSSVVIEFGEPINISDYSDEFLSEREGAPRAAVKRLTRQIWTQLIQLTVNAPDWDALYSANMARHLLWPSDRNIKLSEFVTVYQTLVDLFTAPSPAPNLKKVHEDLLTYYSLLASTHLTNAALSDLPLPRTLDPSIPSPLPTRLATLSVLIRDSIACLVRLPFFLFPLLVHIPAYAMGRVGARLVEDEEETQAQNKIFFSLLSLGLIYPTMFFFLWALFWLTPAGFVVAGISVWAFALYHVRLIDDNYEHAKRLVAAWRVLIGVWGPRKWELPLSALSPWTTPAPPPPNQWIDRNKPPSTTGTPASQPHANLPSTSGANTPVSTPTPATPHTPRRRRPASRRLIRHVLRARLAATHSLATFLADVERAGNENVRASAHLAEYFGGTPDVDSPEVVGDEPAQKGWRRASEVITYLRKMGANIAALQEEEESDWAAVVSDGGEDGDDDETEKGDSETVWATPASTVTGLH